LTKARGIRGELAKGPSRRAFQSQELVKRRIPLRIDCRPMVTEVNRGRMSSSPLESLAERHGNRTHPGRDYRPTPVLKTGPATRPRAAPPLF
jgi:hypothetical protein